MRGIETNEKNNQLFFIAHQCLQINRFIQVSVFCCSDRKWIRILDDVTIKGTTEDPAQQNQSTTKT
jgi:hypothetical protein